MYQGNMLEQGVMDMMGQNISESEMGRVGDGLERKSDSSTENGIQDICSGDDDLDDIAEGSKRKRYHRHTQYQIQEMESFFKECPHPDDKQRRELGRQLGLGPLQVKFWFQNKRTQVKTQNERFENAQLRADNERLKADNMRYKKALQTSACPHCNGPTIIGEVSTDEQHFRAENARLREEIDRISGIAAKYVGRPVQNQSYPPVPGVAPPTTAGSGSFPGVPPIGVAGPEMYMAGAASGGYLQAMGGGATEGDRSLVIELAVLAMEEVMRMAKLGEPLWVPNMDATSLVLNEEEYLRTFPQVIGPRPAGFKFEASRESGLIMMNPHRLVEVLMDVAQWTTMFSGIVTKAATLELLSTGMAGSYNGAVQVMTAEYQVPSPLVPTRECHFVRYCKQHGEGTWAVVDVSIDSLRPSLGVKCRRRPSGCVIQQMHSGYSKVTWIEHVEVNDRDIDNLYKPLVNSLLAFGAKRWVASLDRQCERLQCSMATTIHANNGVVCNQEGRRNMMKLAERMVISFCAGVSSSTTHTWTNLSGSGGDDVKIMTRKSVDDPGRPTGIVLCAATSFWIPYLPRRVFDFLRDENSRNEVSWDILSNGGIVEEITHIANGRDAGNCISLMRVDSTHSNQNTMLILQENSTDPTGSYIIYAPVEVIAMNMVLNGGGNPDYVAILPSGFSILPDGPPTGGAIRHTESPSGSLVTVAFQILVDSLPTAKVALGSVATISSLVTYTVDRIKSAMASQFA